ncbi:MAG: NlpC/P60 family protein [Candidatus Saccharibacteria bacterium]
MRRKTAILVLLTLTMTFLFGFSVEQATGLNSVQWYVDNYNSTYPAYSNYDLMAVNAYRANFDGSQAQALVGRAMWYMQHGYMVYGSLGYATNGTISCSSYVSLVFRDMGYSITSYASRYGSVGTRVSGVYSKLQTGSTSKYMLVGTQYLKPGDIFTFWNKRSDGTKYISHVAIYAGIINGQPWIIHTIKGRPTAIGMSASWTYWYGQHFWEARRVLPSSAQVPGSQGVLSKPVIPAKYVLPPQQPVMLPSELPKGF